LSICNEYSDISLSEGNKLIYTDDIHLTYCSNTNKKIDEHMDSLQKSKIIVSNNSPQNVPLLIVPKKPDHEGNIKYRVCVDFIKLNKITIGKKFPLTNIIHS